MGAGVYVLGRRRRQLFEAACQLDQGHFVECELTELDRVLQSLLARND